MSNIIIDQCPTCGAVQVTVERKQGILVGGCGHMLTELQVRQRTSADKREVAQL